MEYIAGRSRGGGREKERKERNKMKQYRNTARQAGREKRSQGQGVCRRTDTEQSRSQRQTTGARGKVSKIVKSQISRRRKHQGVLSTGRVPMGKKGGYKVM
ncbi:uncharacterized protein TERG_11651 [Trichophyton rubrum CBS 118892]|uniref:Uncharacterized protein n=1 Tax=Trichophyton rubrum (strain ATCC MYA-4607 / CBS 118892) TaxID=559305 RepID=A0A080WGT6_TRIRC|nr:uncharacterized protein TERG_11651 [Trichophyton rubrum CBS 118892]KFL60424.1 hypothetical protein TERG_11651 [Trichophyton rubrum CBS 118892]